MPPPWCIASVGNRSYFAEWDKFHRPRLSETDIKDITSNYVRSALLYVMKKQRERADIPAVTPEASAQNFLVKKHEDWALYQLRSKWERIPDGVSLLECVNVNGFYGPGIYVLDGGGLGLPPRPSPDQSGP